LRKKELLFSSIIEESIVWEGEKIFGASIKLFQEGM